MKRRYQDVIRLLFCMVVGFWGIISYGEILEEQGGSEPKGVKEKTDIAAKTQVDIVANKGRVFLLLHKRKDTTGQILLKQEQDNYVSTLRNANGVAEQQFNIENIIYSENCRQDNHYLLEDRCFLIIHGYLTNGDGASLLRESVLRINIPYLLQEEDSKSNKTLNVEVTMVPDLDNILSVSQEGTGTYCGDKNISWYSADSLEEEDDLIAAASICQAEGTGGFFGMWSYGISGLTAAVTAAITYCIVQYYVFSPANLHNILSNNGIRIVNGYAFRQASGNRLGEAVAIDQVLDILQGSLSIITGGKATKRD